MGKRKRDLSERDGSIAAVENDAKKKRISNGHKNSEAGTIPIQIIVGTYERVLHGIQATLTQMTKGLPGKGPVVEFADTFLLSPHGSAIRCLAISPYSNSDSTKSQKVILASGGSDQIINLYHLSREAPSRPSDGGPEIPSLTGNKVKENPRNRELGSLQHHGGGINALYFPTRSKFLSAAEDNTIAVARTRDWTVLSTIKAPIPKAHGRPSGDTAPLGGTPAGVNDFAIHPSMKLMVSVGKGERCMRLWNLVTGKKAGVLNFDRDMLQGVGEGRWASGEGRRVEWNSLGEEFVVAFERGCVVFGMDCTPKCRIVPIPRTKIHQLHYVTVSADNDETKELLAVSTEDGRILVYSTTLPVDLVTTENGSGPEIPICNAIGQLGGLTEGLPGRIKDFEILKPSDSERIIIVTGSSDGAIRIWQIHEADLTRKLAAHEDSSRVEVDRRANGTAKNALTRSAETDQFGKLLGTYEAGNRITCLKAFLLTSSENSITNDFEASTDRESSMSN